MATVHNRITNVLLALVLLALISLIGMVASGVRGGELDPDGPPGSTMRTLAEIEPRIPITSLPYTIDTSCGGASPRFLAAKPRAGAGRDLSTDVLRCSVRTSKPSGSIRISETSGPILVVL